MFNEVKIIGLIKKQHQYQITYVTIHINIISFQQFEGKLQAENIVSHYLVLAVPRYLVMTPRIHYKMTWGDRTHKV